MDNAQMFLYNGRWMSFEQLKKEKEKKAAENKADTTNAGENSQHISNETAAPAVADSGETNANTDAPVESEAHKCPICKRNFKNDRGLKKHYNTHTDEEKEQNPLTPTK